MFGGDVTIENYHGEPLNFIYVVPPSNVTARQFLSIRTTADTLLPDRWVNLRRQLTDFDTVLFRTYKGYHARGEGSGTLQRFHTWPGGGYTTTREYTASLVISEFKQRNS